MASPEAPRRALRAVKTVNYTQDAGGRTPVWLKKTSAAAEAPAAAKPKAKPPAAVAMRPLDDVADDKENEAVGAPGGGEVAPHSGWSFETPGKSGSQGGGHAAPPKGAAKAAAKAAAKVGKAAPAGTAASGKEGKAAGRKAAPKRPAPAAKADDSPSDGDDDTPVRGAAGAKRAKTAAAKHTGTVIPWPPAKPTGVGATLSASVPSAPPAVAPLRLPPPPPRARAAVSPAPEAPEQRGTATKPGSSRPRVGGAASGGAGASAGLPLSLSDPSAAAALDASMAKANAAQAMAANLAAVAAAAAGGSASMGHYDSGAAYPPPQRAPHAPAPSHSGGAGGANLSEAFSQLQAAYEQLQGQYSRLKAAKQSDLARLGEEQQRLLDEHGAAAARLVAHWRGEAERSAGAAAEAGAAKAQASQLAEQLLAARHEALQCRTQMLAAQGEALGAKQLAHHEQRLRNAAEDTIAVLRAEAALSDAPGPVTAAGVVAALGANAFATPAFQQLTGLAWSRAHGEASGCHQFTHVATGFVFRLQRRGLEPDEEEEDEEDDAEEFDMTYVPVAGTSLLPEDDMLGDRFNFPKASMPELVGKLLVALGAASRRGGERR